MKETLDQIEQKSTIVYFRIPRRKLIGLSLLVAVPWFIVVMLGLRLMSAQSYRTDAGAAPASATVLNTGRNACAPGPWGQLEYVEIVTEPPEEFISPNYFSQAPAWTLKGLSKDQLRNLLNESGVTEAQSSKIMNAADYSNPAGIVIRPDNETVYGISPSARAKLYAALAKFPENTAQVDPFIFKPAKLNEWLDKSNLSSQMVSNIRSLLYPHGETVLLSDCAMALKQITATDERIRLLKILFRRTPIFLKLRVSADSDLDALVRYWGRESREKEVRPLLESLRRTGNTETIDVSLLLPPFARNRIYAYPLPTADAVGKHHDCHWSAFNFFNDQPDERFAEYEHIKTTLDKSYFPVPGVPEFGDLVLFMTPNHSLVHSAVYIADDILFTKNGPSYISPWMLMRAEDIKKDFPAYDSLETCYFRLKK